MTKNTSTEIELAAHPQHFFGGKDIMSRHVVFCAFLLGFIMFGGCGGSKYPFADDFEKGISSRWNVEDDGLKIEVVHGELHLSGPIFGEGKNISPRRKNRQYFPEKGFFGSGRFSSSELRRHRNAARLFDCPLRRWKNRRFLPCSPPGRISTARSKFGKNV